MPILTECTACHRKLRVQDNLLGRAVKCPHCRTKFVAQVPGDAATDRPADDGAEEMTRTPVVPSIHPDMAASAVPTLEITEPASSPSAPRAKPATAERIVPAPAPALAVPPLPAAPIPPQLFETRALHVFTVVAAVFLLALFVSCGVGWWVGTVVENAATAASATNP